MAKHRTEDPRLRAVGERWQAAKERLQRANTPAEERAANRELRETSRTLATLRRPSAEDMADIAEAALALARPLCLPPTTTTRVEARCALDWLWGALDATKVASYPEPIPEAAGWPEGTASPLERLVKDAAAADARLTGKGWPPAVIGLRLRESAKELAAMAKDVRQEDPPSGEDGTAYRPAMEMVREPDYPDLAAVRKALRANPWIRTRRPTSKKNGKPIRNRLEIHAGDWHKMLHGRTDFPDKNVDAYMQEIEERKAEERRRKDQEGRRQGWK